jgi:stage V sporulation protein D (sporulation-specific penicillin-binding protein)
VSLADGTTIRCWTGKGHGNETFAQAMANSCNPVFVRMSERLGGSNNIPVSISKFYSYIKNFGFNDLTGIELPGETNSIFQNKPKMIDMMTASFGQSFTITPIQLIQAYGAIANSGTMNKVHIVKELRDADGNVVKSFEPEALREVVSKETSQTLIDLMKGVITNGTGKNAYIEGYQIAGKTGTSETVESRAGISNRMISSFCAIAPADNPQIVLLVVLDYPTISGAAGEGTAAPVVKDILKNVLPYMGIEKTYTAADVAKIQHTSVMVPVVEGMKLSDAKALLTSKGLSYSVEGDDKSDTAKVVLQTPGKNTYLMQDSRVVLYTYKPESEVTVLVPDVTKQSVDTATNTINYVGLNISISGAGSAVSQTPAAGTLVPKGSVVNVSFK